MEFDPHTRLAGECLQPLGHLSWEFDLESRGWQESRGRLEETEGGGFEPPRRGSPACRFSRPVHSTALPPFHAGVRRLPAQACSPGSPEDDHPMLWRRAGEAAWTAGGERAHQVESKSRPHARPSRETAAGPETTTLWAPPRPSAAPHLRAGSRGSHPMTPTSIHSAHRQPLEPPQREVIILSLSRLQRSVRL